MTLPHSTLEDVAHGRRVRITRHGRVEDSLVLLREDELREMEARASSPLDALRAQFDDMVARMQSPKARKAVASLGDVEASTLGQAALGGRKRGG